MSQDAPEKGSKDFASKWRLVKSCARCHRLKVKCIFEDPTYSTCVRCFSIGVECSPHHDPTAKFARKLNRKSKNIDDPLSKAISSLKEVQTALSSLKSDDLKNQDTKKLTDLTTVFTSLAYTIENVTGNNQISATADIAKSSVYPKIGFDKNLAKELIYTHKALSEKEAKRRFHYFINDILCYYPIIVFSEQETDFDYSLNHAPLVLMSCIFVTTLNDTGLSDTTGEGLDFRSLNKMLIYYLDEFIAYFSLINPRGVNHHLIIACIILSQWCCVPQSPDHFKSQIQLFTGVALSRCIDIASKLNPKCPNMMIDNSKERIEVRILLTIYCCCGSLEFPLPKYKILPWSDNYEKAVDILLSSNKMNGFPKRQERYICYFSKIVHLVQEMLEVQSLTLKVSTDSNDDSDPMFQRMWGPGPSSTIGIRSILEAYEKKLHQTFADSGFMVDDQKSGRIPREKYLLSLMYYQALMIVYDNLISGYLYSKKAAFMQPESSSIFNEMNSLACMRDIAKLIKLTESLLNSFIMLCEETINLPTYFFYRALRALVTLIRMQLLMKSQIFSNTAPNNSELNGNVEIYFEKLTSIVNDGVTKHDLYNLRNISPILHKISIWIKVCNGYNTNTSTTNQNNGTTKSNANVDFIKLTDMSKDTEIQNLGLPKTKDSSKYLTKRRRLDNNASLVRLQGSSQSNMQQISKSNNVLDLVNPESPVSQPLEVDEYVKSPKGPFLSRFIDDPADATNSLNTFSIQEIFREIDTDVLSFLDPVDQSYFNDGINFPFDTDEQFTTN